MTKQSPASRKLTSFSVADKKDWLIKLSVTRNPKAKKPTPEDRPSIMIVLMSKISDEVIVKFFSNEQQAIDFVDQTLETPVLPIKPT